MEINNELSTSWHSYPKVHALGHKMIRELLDDPVICEEKIDGSQISWGIFNGELRIKSKDANIVIDKPEKMFAIGVEVIERLDLHDRWTYRGEYLSKPKHNALAYDRVPTKNIIIFDINDGYESYLDYNAKQAEAERIGLETVPLLYSGKISSPDELLKLLATTSILGGQLIEGTVIKNYTRFATDGHAMIGKYVSEKYKEVHKGEWRTNNPANKDVIEAIISKLKTESRWDKAVQHLRERGELEDSPRDIGRLIAEVQKDTLEECNDIIVDALMSYAVPKIKRGIISGVPEWYKGKLLEKQFEKG